MDARTPGTTDARTDAAALVAEIATTLLQAGRPEEIVPGIFAHLARHLDLDLFLHYLVASDGARLELACSSGVADDAIRHLGELAFGEGVCGTVAARRTPIVCSDVQQHCGDPMLAVLGELGVRAYACHPLLGRRALIGTLSFGSRTRDALSAEDLQLIKIVAGCIAVAIERDRAEEMSRRAHAALAQAGTMAHLGAWWIDFSNHDDLNANPLHWSDEVYRIFGYEPRAVAVTNETFFSRVHPDDRPAVSQAVDRAMAEKRSYSIEHRIIRPDGSERIVQEHADIEFDAAGRPRSMIGAVQDVTERKRVEDALARANRRLAEADRRKDEFLAVLSHELRNPLAPIRYALPVLQRERLGEAGTRAIAVIDRQMDHVSRLVDDLLDVSRITRGKIELRREDVSLGAIVAAAAESASPAVLAGRHTLKIAVAEEPVWLHADPARLAQVVTNLVNNSARYTPPGGEIVVRAGREGNQAVIRVRDSGIGIPEQALDSVFDMFQQVADRHHPGRVAGEGDRSRGGLGIGLALARRLVALHGGTIEAFSAGSGKGAEFVVQVPMLHETEMPRGEDREAVARAGAATPRLKVLVVDDNEDLVEMLAASLSVLGHDVRKAVDGPGAIAEALNYHPDVVLLDLGLPGMSGLDVARELRRNPETADVRLVALTGWGQARDRSSTRDAGFDCHLTKPSDPVTLERLLAEFAATRVR